MHELLNMLEQLDEAKIRELRRIRLPTVQPRDLSNPMAYIMEHEFIQGFRLTKAGVWDLLEQIRPRLPRLPNRKSKLMCRARNWLL